MKSLYLVSIFLLLALAAQADLVIKQKVENTMQSGVVTIKIKGNKVRMDMDMGKDGPATSAIVDLTTGDTVNMMSQQKMLMRMSGEQMKQTVDQMEKMMNNGTNAPPKLVDTGKSETINGYKAEIYSWTNALLKNGGTAWVAKDYPGLKSIKGQLSGISSSPFFKMRNNMMPDTIKLPGLEVKTMSDAHGMQTTVTLISAKEEAVDDSVFVVPSDYQEMKVPSGVPSFRPPARPPAPQ